MSKPALLDSISPGFKALSAQFLAAGLDLPAILAAGPNGLKDKIESLKGNSSDAAAAVEAATAALQAQLDTATQSIALSGARLVAFNAALVSFGAQPKASDDKAGITAADIEKSLRDRASILAGEQLAKHGIAAALPLAPSADATKPADTKGTGLTRTEAAYRAKYPHLT